MPIPAIGLAGDFTELVHHLWAHVRAPEPGSSHDPRYISWARERLEDETAALLRRDAAIIGPRWDHAFHRWSELHDNIAAFRATSALTLGDVSAAQVTDADVLYALQRVDGPVPELIHATLGLLAPELERLYAGSIAPSLRAAAHALEPYWAMACAITSGLAQRKVELSHCLGPRGRAHRGRIVVGAAANWNGQVPATSIIVAMHEHLVLASPGRDYATAEWDALTTNAARMAAAPPELRGPHEDWIATLDLRALVSTALQRAWIGAPAAASLLAASEPATRVRTLASATARRRPTTP